MAWKTTNGQTKAKEYAAQLEVLIHGLLNPVTLLDMIRHFIVFESTNKKMPMA
jgi:type I restriction enzyme R subunit